MIKDMDQMPSEQGPRDTFRLTEQNARIGEYVAAETSVAECINGRLLDEGKRGTSEGFQRTGALSHVFFKQGEAVKIVDVIPGTGVVFKAEGSSVSEQDEVRLVYFKDLNDSPHAPKTGSLRNLGQIVLKM